MLNLKMDNPFLNIMDNKMNIFKPNKFKKNRRYPRYKVNRGSKCNKSYAEI